MNPDSWLFVICIILGYCSFIGIILLVSALLRKQIDKVAEESKKAHKNSLEIISNVPMNDKGCDIDKVFSDLEEQGINLSFRMTLE